MSHLGVLVYGCSGRRCRDSHSLTHASYYVSNTSPTMGTRWILLQLSYYLNHGTGLCVQLNICLHIRHARCIWMLRYSEQPNM